MSYGKTIRASDETIPLILNNRNGRGVEADRARYDKEKRIHGPTETTERFATNARAAHRTTLQFRVIAPGVIELAVLLQTLKFTLFAVGYLTIVSIPLPLGL